MAAGPAAGGALELVYSSTIVRNESYHMAMGGRAASSVYLDDGRIERFVIPTECRRCGRRFCLVYLGTNARRVPKRARDHNATLL